MHRHITRAIAALVLAATSACSSDSATTPPEEQGPQAELKVLNASAGAGALDIDVGDKRVITGLSEGRSSALTLVPAGSQRVRVKQGSTVIAELETTLSTQRINVVTVAQGNAQVSSSIIPDTGQAASNRANVRVINIASGNTADPTMMHLLINFPDVSTDSTARIGLDTKIASHGTLMYFNPGQFRFRLVPQNTTDVLAEETFTVAAGEKRAVVVERAANGSYSLRVVIEQ